MAEARLPESAGCLKKSLIVINILLFLIGIALCVLGADIDSFITSSTIGLHYKTPPLWWTGVLPLLVGISGVIIISWGLRKWLLVWLIVSSFLGILFYLLLSLLGCLESADYGVTRDVYGVCISTDNNTCLCSREKSDIRILYFAGCDDIWRVTTIYLVVLCLLVLGLTIGAGGAVLACIATLCIQKCQPREFRPVSQSFTCDVRAVTQGSGREDMTSEATILNTPSPATAPLPEVGEGPKFTF